MHRAVKTGLLEEVKTALAHDVTNPNNRDNRGRTALHNAVALQLTDIVKLLVGDRRFYINARDKRRMTALDIATDSMIQSEEIVKILLSHHDINTMLKNTCYGEKNASALIRASTGIILCPALLQKRHLIKLS